MIKFIMKNLLILITIITFLTSCVFKCPDCNGQGTITEECERCDGSCKIPCSTCFGNGYVSCQDCDGSGKKYCMNCNGQGKKICSVCHGCGLESNGLNYSGCTACDDSGVYIGRICPFCKYFRYHDCGNCSGRGFEDCFNCNGSGSLRCSDCQNGFVECPNCDGTGSVKKHVLSVTGQVRKNSVSQYII